MKSTAALLFLALALVSPVRAQDDAGAMHQGGEATLGLRGSYFVPGDSTSGDWNPGVQGRYFFSSRFAAEAAVEYQHETFPGTTADTGAAQASLLAYFGNERWSVFPLIGAGYYISRVESDNFHRDIGRIGPHLGAGAEIRLGGPWTADFTYRHIWLSDLTSSAGTFTRSGDEISFGLNYRIGG
jgi:opacity protein-like surface antigen